MTDQISITQILLSRLYFSNLIDVLFHRTQLKYSMDTIFVLLGLKSAVLHCSNTLGQLLFITAQLHAVYHCPITAYHCPTILGTGTCTQD